MFVSLLLLSFRTSTFHVCLPFTFQLADKLSSQVSFLLPPRYPPSVLYRAEGSVVPLLVAFDRMLLTHALAPTVSQFLCARKSPYEFIRVYARWDSNSRNWTRAGTRIKPAAPPGRPVCIPPATPWTTYCRYISTIHCYLCSGCGHFSAVCVVGIHQV